MIGLFVPVKTETLNVALRTHWRAHARKAKAQRQATRITWMAAGQPVAELPACVTLTRVAPRDLDDDNLAGSLKHVRDEVAATALRVDDRDPRVTWLYAQARGARPKQIGVHVRIDEAGDRPEGGSDGCEK